MNSTSIVQPVDWVVLLLLVLLIACLLDVFFVISLMFDKPSSTIECHSTLSSYRHHYSSLTRFFIIPFVRSFVHLVACAWMSKRLSCIFRSALCFFFCSAIYVCECVYIVHAEKRGRNIKMRWRVMCFCFEKLVIYSLPTSKPVVFCFETKMKKDPEKATKTTHFALLSPIGYDTRYLFTCLFFRSLLQNCCCSLLRVPHLISFHLSLFLHGFFI